jgi:lysozyme family protein
MTIETFIENVIGKEGGYSNHPNDTGGATRWGITEAVARANGYHGDMRTLPRDAAKEIYRNQYVVKPGFAKIAEISELIAEELVDTGVNMGPAVPAMMLQRALNALNNEGRDYGDIAVDGQAGPGTRAALRAYLGKRGRLGEMVLLRALNCLQGERYIELAEKRQKNESFVFGWLRSRVA